MRKGSYQLLIHLPTSQPITIGRLGTFHFPSGYYIYTGSAMGGLDSRIARHLSKTKQKHWHVDYLLEHSAILRYAIRVSPSRMECGLNAQTLAMEGAQIPIPGFGSSDCKCVAHLVYFKDEPPILPADSM